MRLSKFTTSTTSSCTRPATERRWTLVGWPQFAQNAPASGWPQLAQLPVCLWPLPSDDAAISIAAALPVSTRTSRSPVTGPSQKHGGRFFDELPERLQEAGAGRTIDDPVIAGQRDGHHRRGLDLVADHHSALLACAHCHDRGMRRVDHGGEILDAEHAEIGDREGAALELLRLQLLGAGALGQRLHLVGDDGKAL